MDFPEADFPAVGEAAHAVMRNAIKSGVWIVGGGFSIIEVSTDHDALEWAAKFAVACRCAQEVRKIMADPLQESLQGR